MAPFPGPTNPRATTLTLGVLYLKWAGQPQRPPPPSPRHREVDAAISAGANPACWGNHSPVWRVARADRKCVCVNVCRRRRWGEYCAALARVAAQHPRIEIGGQVRRGGEGGAGGQTGIAGRRSSRYALAKQVVSEGMADMADGAAVPWHGLGRHV